MENTFDQLGYQVVNNVISAETAEILANGFANLRNSIYLRNGEDIDKIGYSNDPQVEKSFSYYGSPTFEALLEAVQPLVESVTGKELWPTYSYARIYYPDAEMVYHIDRPSCEYSMTLTLQTDGNPWPIWFIDKQNETKEVILDVGVGCVYRGMELPHWRTQFTGSRQIQVFLHYVDKNGPHASLKYDERIMIGAPRTLVT